MYLEKNISLLKNINPNLAEKLEKLNIDNNLVEIFSTDINGYYTCRVAKTENHAKLLLHSAINPIQEAQEQISGLEGLDKAYFACIFGFGFGYHVRELFKKKIDRGCVLVIEPRLDVLKAALSCMDFSDLFKGDKLYIMDMEGNFKDNLYEVMKNWLYIYKNLRYYNLPAYDSIIENGIQPVREIFRDTLQYAFFSIGNSAGDTLQGIGNTFNNLEFIFNSFDITSLKSKYKGVPAIIVSAGPSLDKNFRLLKGIKGKALIISAETILEKLLKNNIKPDIVSVLERGVYVYETFFKDKEIDPEIVLCGQSLISNEIFKNYPGKKITCIKKDTRFESWISGINSGINTFHPGQSVANMNYALARELGCDPIILIGQDLSYSIEGNSHAGETVYQNRKSEDDKVRFEAEPIQIKGNYTDFVYTNIYWHQFLKWFEIEIPKTNAKVINATEGGAYIKGTELMTMKEALEKYCLDREINVDVYNDIAIVTKEENELRLNRFIAATEEELLKLYKTKEILQEGVNVCLASNSKKLKTQIDVSKYFNQINVCRIDLQATSDLFNFIIQAQKTVIFLRDADFISLRNIDDFKKWVEVQEEYFSDLLKVMEFTIKIFKFGLLKARLIKGDKVEESLDLKELLKEIGV